LYHCIHQNKIMLVYKDHNEILNCYEIDDSGNVNFELFSKGQSVQDVINNYS